MGDAGGLGASPADMRPGAVALWFFVHMSHAVIMPRNIWQSLSEHISPIPC
ncbi:MAG: hypothetical protein QG582_416 [Candidatus Thermoplasmatota archaeon]|nr:hypothetical protein [Candidatus Thermoplasmatota archaeon]